MAPRHSEPPRSLSWEFLGLQEPTMGPCGLALGLYGLAQGLCDLALPVSDLKVSVNFGSVIAIDYCSLKCQYRRICFLNFSKWKSSVAFSVSIFLTLAWSKTIKCWKLNYKLHCNIMSICQTNMAEITTAWNEYQWTWRRTCTYSRASMWQPQSCDALIGSYLDRSVSSRRHRLSEVQVLEPLLGQTSAYGRPNDPRY